MASDISTDIYRFETAKNNFHESRSWGESMHCLRLFMRTSRDKKLRKKILVKFLWYRVLRFWSNKNFGPFQSDSTPYRQLVLQKGTVLLFTHELSLSGAPMALLNLALVLKKMDKRPVIISPLQGELSQTAQELAIMTVVDPFLEFKLYMKDAALFDLLNNCEAILFNTLDNLHFSLYTQDVKVRQMGWIHEAASSYNSKFIGIIEESLRTLNELYVVGPYAKAIAAQHMPAGKPLQSLLYGCADIDLQPHGSTAQDKIKIIVIGTIDERKGMHLLNDIVNHLSKEAQHRIEIIVIGKPVCPSIARSLRNSRHECLHYLGQLPHKEVIRHLNDSDILLCPSLDDPMPIVCTEAMILRKVVIVSDHTGTASLLTDGINGFIIPANSPQAAADSIEDVLDKRNQYCQIGDEARKTYEKFFTMRTFEQNVREIFSRPYPSIK